MPTTTSLVIEILIRISQCTQLLTTISRNRDRRLQSQVDPAGEVPEDLRAKNNKRKSKLLRKRKISLFNSKLKLKKID
jgi:hypothetical protein